MKYMMLIYMDEHALDEAARQACYAESARFAQELDKTAQYLGAGPLQPTSQATSVRMKDGKPLVTDGPFAETREQLAGYFLVEAKDLDEAIGIAARIPAGRWGTVEIRPLVEIAGLPEDTASRPPARIPGPPPERAARNGAHSSERSDA